jgi:NTE family protein
VTHLTTAGTALILGGGGPVGIAWECGILLGLRDAGVDLTQSDRVVGTSAGSLVAAHLAFGTLEDLYTAREAELEQASKTPSLSRMIFALVIARLFFPSLQGTRRWVAKSAKRARIPGEQAWLERIRGHLPEVARTGSKWPDRDVRVTAIDVESGQLLTWTRDSGVPLSLAVASSCAVPCVFPLVQINDRAYMDGGIGSPTNAELGEGFARVVILDPMARLLGSQSPLRKEQRALEEQGSRVHTIVFDDPVHAVVGRNLMDASRCKLAAELGRVHGQRLAKELV